MVNRAEFTSRPTSRRLEWRARMRLQAVYSLHFELLPADGARHSPGFAQTYTMPTKQALKAGSESLKRIQG